MTAEELADPTDPRFTAAQLAAVDRFEQATTPPEVTAIQAAHDGEAIAHWPSAASQRQAAQIVLGPDWRSRSQGTTGTHLIARVAEALDQAAERERRLRARMEALADRYDDGTVIGTTVANALRAALSGTSEETTDA